MQLIRVTKAGEVFLLVSDRPMEAHDIAEVVDHADVHYSLGSERADRDLVLHGIHPVGHARFSALQKFGEKVAELKL